MAQTAAAKPIPDLTRLSRADEALILKLHEDGRTQVEISQLIGCSQPTVSRVIHLFSDTRPKAKLILNNAAETLAKRIRDKANPATALEVLDRLKVTEKPNQDSKASIQVFIGARDSDIQVNVIANYQTQSESESQTGQSLTDVIDVKTEAKVPGESGT